jgi:hypothetical protein
MEVPMTKQKLKFNVLDLFGAIPIIVEAIQGVVDEVEAIKSSDSAGGAKVTPEEGLALAKEIHERLFPLAEYIVSKVK